MLISRQTMGGGAKPLSGSRSGRILSV